MQIGFFRKTKGGFSGQLQTLTLDLPLRILPARGPAAQNAPAWRVLLGEGENHAEVGAGWDHHRGEAGDFIALELDCPALPKPIRANLLPPRGDDDRHVLLWSRRRRRPAS